MSLRPDLKEIEASYALVLQHWSEIDDELDWLGIGRKDAPFTVDIMANMLHAWEYMDYFLKIEGNHRSGSIAASWINLVNDLPPFVLNVDNAVAFFSPAQEIKKFNKRSVWQTCYQVAEIQKGVSGVLAK